MEIIPAIYILDGVCVALYKGSLVQKETYFKNPVHVAKAFVKEGSNHIYVADINGKNSGKLEQQNLISQLLKTAKTDVYLESGFQNLEDIDAAFKLGASKIILVSPNLNFAKAAIEKYGSDKIIVQILAHQSEVIFMPWNLSANPQKTTEPLGVVDYAESLVKVGVKVVIYKDQTSEGTMIHPNYDEVDRLFLTCGKELKIYSSGGISSINHLQLLKKIGASGAIIGKALFERVITLKEASQVSA